MRRWLVRLGVVVALLLGMVVLHAALVAGARAPGSLGRLSGATCAACHAAAR